MRSLKILVVVMGVLLVGGTAALVAAIAVRLSQRGPAAATFAAPPVALPNGARIEAMSTGPDRIVLNVLLVDGARELVVIDLHTGRQLGTIPLAEQR